MQLKPTIIIKIFVVVALVASVGIFAYVYSMQKAPVKQLDDTIEFERRISSEKAGDFVALLAEDTEGLAPNETQVTVYNQDLALIKESREIDLTEGYNQVKYQDVPTKINPSSVIFKDMTNQDTEVLEQTYEYDLVSQNKLLEKYLDEDITVFSSVENGVKEYSGKLVSYKDGVMLDTGNGVVSIKDVQSIEFTRLPEGLITKPTLVWSIFAGNEGMRNVLTTYLTAGMTWKADYVAKVNKDDNAVDLKGWTTINNTSGTSYPNATLKLVAGDVNVVTPAPGPKMYDQAVEAPAMEARVGGGGFAEEQFFEYHLYTLGRKTNLKDNQQKQISLLNTKGVGVNKQLVYQSSKAWDKVRTMLETENTEEKGLGIPLPKGVIRVYKEDSEGHLQFIGEDRIDHTPKDEEIEIFLGNAFDITVEKTTQESKRTGGLLDFGGRCQMQDINIEFANHKEEEDVEIKVIEEWYAPDITIVDSNYESEKEDEYTYIFYVPVESDGENSLTYTIRQCW